MLATDPGDVHGFSFQDQRKIGPYTVAAPWIAEEFPELATHGDDPFIRHLEGETAFEHPRRERIARRCARGYPLATLFFFILLGLASIRLFYPSLGRVSSCVIGGLIFMGGFEEIFFRALAGWSGIRRETLYAIGKAVPMMQRLSQSDEASLPLSPRERLLVVLPRFVRASRWVTLMSFLGLATISAFLVYLNILGKMSSQLILFEALFLGCLWVLPLELKGSSVVLSLVQGISTWKLMQLKLGLLEPDEAKRLTSGSRKPLHVFVAILGMTPLLLYQVFAAFVVYAALTISGRPSGVLPWVLLALLPFLTPAWVRRIAQGAIRYLARFVIADAIAIQRAKFGGDDVVTFPKAGA